MDAAAVYNLLSDYGAAILNEKELQEFYSLDKDITEIGHFKYMAGGHIHIFEFGKIVMGGGLYRIVLKNFVFERDSRLCH